MRGHSRAASATARGLVCGLTRRTVATVMVVLVCATTALANGAAFFRPAGRNAHVDLVYFGSIRDRSGRPLDFVDVTITAGDLTFPFANNSPGHYRSPDVGALIKEAGAIVNPAQLEITCYVSGYRQARRSVPRRSTGIVEVDFTMDEDGDAPRDVPRAAPAGRSWHVPASGLLVLLLSAMGVRTAGRRRSTTD